MFCVRFGHFNFVKSIVYIDLTKLKWHKVCFVSSLVSFAKKTVSVG
jgi:hypothetical protein